MRSALLPLTALVLFLSCTGAPDGGEDYVIARVGDATLTRREAGRLQIEAKQGALGFPTVESVVESWVYDQLAYQEAKRQGIDKEEEMAWALTRQATILLRAELVKREVLDRLPPVTEAQAVEYYERHRESFRAKEPMVWVWVIEREDEPSAQRVLERLKPDGSNFRAEAQLWSLGVAQPKGGDRGYLGQSRLKPELWAVCQAIPLERVSGVLPFKLGTANRYAIVFVKDRIEPGEYMKPEGVGFDMLKERAAADLYREALKSYMDGLRERTTVYVDSNAIAQLDAEAARIKAEIKEPVPILE
ncbi:MAG TPA: peptidyl-prolyl cis-trans isomerase [Candidatus Coatesbacteria bacterium]|nr:peptidyl-prolyl cis-trans isomerase [Candidatus Coatesbacteria bacterium]